MMRSCFPSSTAVLVLILVHSSGILCNALLSNTHRRRTDGLSLFTQSGHSRSVLSQKPTTAVVDWKRSTSSTTILRANFGSRKGGNPAFSRNKKIVELGRNRQWKEMLLIHEKEQEGFDNVNYSTMMSQLGRIRSMDRRDPLFKAFLDDLGNQVEVHGLRWLRGQATGNIMHAIAKMNLMSHRTSKIIFSQVESNADWLVKSNKPQNIANSVWACATLGVESPNLFSQVEKHAEWFFNEGNPQDIANTVWAFATLGVESPKLFSQVEKHAKRLVKEGTPQAIANTVWACATLGVESPELFLQVEEHAERLVKEGTPQNIANTVWACATLGVDSPKLFSQVEKDAERFVKEGTPQAIANAVWAFATLGVASPKLFLQVEKHAERFVKEGKPQEIANTVWACATLGVKSPNLFSFLEAKKDKLLQSSNGLDFCLICYAIALSDLGKRRIKLLVAMWNRAIQMTTSSFTREALIQLVQVEAFMKADRITLEEPPTELRLSMVSIVENDNTASRSHAQISGMLTKLGFIHENEVPPLAEWAMGGMLAIDMACTTQKIAIEFDGPSHYLKSVRTGDVMRVENGATKAKRRFLERVGWKVINLNYQDWIDVNHDTSEGILFLKNKLSDAGVKLSR